MKEKAYLHGENMLIANICKSLLFSAFILSSSSFAMNVAKDDKEARDLGPQPVQQFNAANYRAKPPMKESTKTAWGALMGSVFGLIYGLVHASETRSPNVMQNAALGTAIGGISGALLGYAIARSKREEDKKREEAMRLTNGGDIRAAACQGNIDALRAWYNAQSYKQHYPFRHTDSYGRSVLHYAAGNGHAQACQYIQDNSPAYVDVTRVVDSTNNGVYLSGAHATINSTTRERSRFFYLDAGDNQRKTPLHHALYGNHIQAAITLLNAGASPDLQDYSGKTADSIITQRLPQQRNQFAQPLQNARTEYQRKFVAPTRSTQTTTSVGVSDGISSVSTSWQTRS